MSGTWLGTCDTIVNKTWFLTLKIIHHYSPIVAAVMSTLTDCPKSGATQMQNEGKKSDGDLRLRVLYCTSNPFLSPEQMLVSASADTVAGRHETSNLGASSLLN